MIEEGWPRNRDRRGKDGQRPRRSKTKTIAQNQDQQRPGSLLRCDYEEWAAIYGYIADVSGHGFERRQEWQRIVRMPEPSYFRSTMRETEREEEWRVGRTNQ